MTAFAAIVTDVQGRADTGDLAAAATRVTDLETAWDEAEPKLRPLDAAQWGTVDDAIDGVLQALRAGTPAPDVVTADLAALQTVLADPAAALKDAGQGQVVMVGSVAVTDELGHAVPCEELLATLRAGLAGAKLSAADQGRAQDLQAKATERCNADDDARSDAFSAQALALVTQ